MEPLRHIKTGNAKGQISIKSTSTTALECVVDSWSSKEITSLLHKHAKCSSYKVPTTSLKQLSTQERSRVTRDHSPVLLSPKVNLVPGHPPRQPVSAHLRPLQRPCCWPWSGRRAGCHSAGQWGSLARSAAARTEALPWFGWCCYGTSRWPPF